MDELIARLKLEASAIASAPILSAVALFGSLAAIWGVTHWGYRGLLASQEAHIASLERRVNEYRDKLNGASPAQARARIDALEAEVRALRIRLSPRRLTPTQRQAIIDHSRRPAGAAPLDLTVVAEEKCSDCAAFAAALIEAMRSEGSWNVTTGTAATIAERPRNGIGIQVADPLQPPVAASVLRQALQFAGFAVDVLKGGAEGSVTLLITERAPQ